MTKSLPVPSSSAEVAALLHEAVVHGRIGGALVVGRRRPFIPCGVDPQPINAECARRYAVMIDALGTPMIREIDPVNVRSFEVTR